jgi:hypothetical protein
MQTNVSGGAWCAVQGSSTGGGGESPRKEKEEEEEEEENLLMLDRSVDVGVKLRRSAMARTRLTRTLSALSLEETIDQLDYYEMFPENLRRADAFDIILFRGSEAVTKWIQNMMHDSGRISCFTHCGMCLKAPFIPTNGSYRTDWRQHFEKTYKDLSFVELNTALLPALTVGEVRRLRVTVKSCARLPEVLDEGTFYPGPSARLCTAAATIPCYVVLCGASWCPAHCLFLALHNLPCVGLVNHHHPHYRHQHHHQMPTCVCCSTRTPTVR